LARRFAPSVRLSIPFANAIFESSVPGVAIDRNEPK
jgi:hypothetical protein